MSDSHKIIVIEDDSVISSMLGMLLQSMGHTVDTAPDKDTALQKIEAAHHSGAPFTTATVDMNYEIGKKGDEWALGTAIIREIKARFPYVATVMITGSQIDPHEILEYRDDYGMDQFLQKDGINPKLLSMAIERATTRVNAMIASGHVSPEALAPRRDGVQPEKVLVKPVFGVPHEISQFQCDVFMIMPFADQYRAVYFEHVQPTIEGMGLSIKRGDDFFSKHDIMVEIWSAVYAAQFVIADCSGHNANVFYELGIAHTIGKPAILMTQTIEDIPFDIRGKRVIRYEPTAAGLVKLRDDIRGAVDLLRQDAG